MDRYSAAESEISVDFTRIGNAEIFLDRYRISRCRSDPSVFLTLKAGFNDNAVIIFIVIIQVPDLYACS